MQRETAVRQKKIKVQSYYDYSLFFLIIFLVCLGLVMIYSTSSYNAARYYNDATLYLRRQGSFALLGLVVMYVVSKIDYHVYINPLPIIKVRPIVLFFFLCLMLQTYVLFNGHEAGGSSRWISLGSLGNFQPSEVTKICFILMVAYIVQLAPKRLDKIWGFLRITIYMGPLIVLVIMQNFSTALILFSIMTAVCFVASRKKGYYLIAGIGFAGIGAVFIAMFSYRFERFKIWLDVENHPLGFQIIQGLYAIATGGLFGKGLGESMQKLGYIPEVHTDMIFTIICEELGIFGAIAVISLFLLIIWRLFFISVNAPDLYGGLIAVGVLIHIAVQVLINIAVVTSSIPATGIPLPFLSYGGSSLLVLMAEMGIALSVSNQITRER